MATFTATKTKPKLNWDAPPPVEQSGQAYELLIGSGFKLDIGSGYNLTVQTADAPIQWTQVTKGTSNHNWPQTATERFALDIGGFNLLVDSDSVLLVTGSGQRTPKTDTWTPTTKGSVPSY